MVPCHLQQAGADVSRAHKPEFLYLNSESLARRCGAALADKSAVLDDREESDV